MMFARPGCLWLVIVCVCCLSAGAQTQQPSPPQQKDQQNPFETVPQAAEEPPKPARQPPAPAQAKPGLEAPAAVPAPKPAPGRTDIVEAVEFKGARRVPQDTLRAMIYTKKGDRYEPETLRRDFMVLWNSARFDDIRLEQEQGPNGIIVRFVLVERPVVRSIKYEGIKSVSVSEILDRFKERHVGLTVESQFDQNKVQRAAVVLKEFLSERGRQYATVTPELRQIPPSSLEVTFRVNEGPKVKVGEIAFDGNEMASDEDLVHAMKNLRPLGLPHSILFENLFAKTYDLSKLEEDREGIRNFYQDRGYFMIRTLEPTVTLRKVGGGKFRVPLFYMNQPGIRAGISIPVEEGRKYKIRNWNYVGVKLFRVPEALTTKMFGMGPGDVFSTAKFRKGIERMRELYGMYGYIDFVPDPLPEAVTGTDQVDVTFNVDEGKQFYIRRIDFTGNTTTRDKVIRRELMVDEGDLFNSKMWEMSVLRLNQLGYFEMLKKEDAAQITRDPHNNTVDILLKVKERGKNTIGLTGGVSGIAGSFVGLNYSTNNFMGLGETLSLSSQLGTRLQNVTFGFTEPYFLNRPIQLGFTVFTQRYNYDQGREASILAGENLIPYYQALGAQNLMNYIQDSKGFTVFATYPMRRTFARLGLTYGFSESSYKALTTAATDTFEYLNYLNLSGPSALRGIKTSQITPSYSYNSVNHPLDPTGGRSLSIATGFASSAMGGNVNLLQPTVSATWFHTAPGHKTHVIGIRLMSSFVTGYGGKEAPPMNRYYIGGENDVRGFEIMAISPMAFMPSQATVPVYNSDGSARLQKIVTNGVVSYQAVSMSIPTYQVIFPGGDFQAVGNFEYRIPLGGPVKLAFFFDVGMDKALRPDQLQITEDWLTTLNGAYPTAGFDKRVLIAQGTQKIRTSVGPELQVLLPVVNAPFRVYWAYNPTTLRQYIQPPLAADRSMFPNQATFVQAVGQFGQAYPFFEKRDTFRFTVGRTF
jgi:outer membrane protein insertion porin family